MAILTFQKPDFTAVLESDEKRGVFELRPLQPGFGITVGNALRRVLLSSLEGFAITSVKIEGVEQEFSTIEGVIEDVTDIILNLKQIRFKRQVEGITEEKVNITIGDQEVFKAGDINKFLNNFQIIDPELVICHMEPSVKLNLEITIDKGRGYVLAEDNKTLHEGIGIIVMDSIHTPIRNVKYHIDDFRVEQKTDFEKLTIEIETDGSIHPKDALKEGAKILIQHFMLFSDDKITFEAEEKSITEEFDENSLHIRQVLKTKLTDLDLSVRALNCLKAAYVETLGDLVTYQKNELLKFRNFGKKSLSELEDLLESKNLEFGMNVDKYKLDKD
ncbi:MAG: DNA-directed RNA polymerase subunit alpha [Bacteroidales bacterium]